MSAARHQRAVCLALGVSAALWAPAPAQAREGPSEIPRGQLEWPLVQSWELSERPRLFLHLPAHWRPPPTPGALDLGEGVVLVRHSSRHLALGASFSGTTLQLNLQHRAVELELFVKTQSVVAVLRFDPIPARLR